MTKKKSGSTGRRRKKSNTTTQNAGAKRSKTAEEKNSVEYRNGILQGIRALLGKMDDNELLALMAYGVSTMEDKQKSTSLQPSMTVTATAREEATATATGTAIVNTTAEAANFTTTEGNPSGAQQQTTTAPAEQAANPTTGAVREEFANNTTTATVPPSPEDPAVIQLNKNTRVSPHNIVTIDPRCFHCDGITEVAATKSKNKSINTIVNAMVKNDLTPQQRAFALQQAVAHPDVRALAKSAGLIDDQDFIKKNYILKNMKTAVRLAQETSKRNARPNDDRRSLVQSVVVSKDN